MINNITIDGLTVTNLEIPLPKPYREGILAQLNEQPLTTNPHLKFGLHWASWNMGWIYAMKTMCHLTDNLALEETN